MDSPALTNLLKLLASGKDSALLRFGLGNEYLKLDQAEQAVVHLRQAVALDAHYSAAWKQLGRALTQTGDREGALAAYREGIAVAQAKGDQQTAKEMTVFARRLENAD